jgi:hypothetical protein
MPQQGKARVAPPVPMGVATWFSAQDAPLLSSKAVRSYLAPYSPHCWPEVTRLTLLYGMAALRASYGDAPLTLAELAEVVGAEGAGRGWGGAVASAHERSSCSMRPER